ncbi:hypothetical protein [Enterobacter cloacae]
MSIKDLVSNIKHNGLLASMAQLEKLYKIAIENEEKLAETEARCAALAAEMAWLKKFCKDAAFDADYEAELGMERGGFTDALNDIKTPATDALLAEVRAQGVEMFSERFGGGTLLSDMVKETAKEFAAQLRKGVQA